MPNWCNNEVTLSHDDPAMIERAEKAFKAGAFLSEFIPCPKPLLETMSGSYGEEYEREVHEAIQKINTKHFGFPNWYDWCCAKWGTKWDVGRDGSCEVEGQSLKLSFDSAWSPPIAAYETLESLGFSILAYYYEPGCSFCGRYQEDQDDYFEIRGGADWTRRNIPRDIDEALNISENMAVWETQ